MYLYLNYIILFFTITINDQIRPEQNIRGRKKIIK